MKRALLLTVPLVLVACGKPKSDPKLEQEIRERDDFARAVVVDAGASRALKVASRTDALFEEGFSAISYDPPDDWHNHAFRWMGQNGHVRLKMHGDRTMKIKLGGWVNEKVIRAKPVISAYIDGQFIGTTGAVESGHFFLEADVPSALARGKDWVDLNITSNAVAYHWGDPPDLKVIVFYNLEWYEL